jgi:hypothetical protein
MFLQWIPRLLVISSSQVRWLYTLSGLSLIALLAFMSVISTLKPWTKQDRLNAKPKVSRGLASAETEH